MRNKIRQNYLASFRRARQEQHVGLYNFMRWLRTNYDLTDVESLQVITEIFYSLPVKLTPDEINTYICKVRAANAQPGTKPDEHQ